MTESGPSLAAVLILNWRDRKNPEGGGSELYADYVAAHLARRGHRVTLLCAAHGEAPTEETTAEGVRILRRGGKKSVYGRAAWEYLRRRVGPVDVIVDVQNGLPFLARLWSRKPVVVLVHHVHREQWRVVLGPAMARFGWWVESRFSPWIHRRCPYVAVSESTRAELVDLGVDRDRITVVHNGTPQASGPPRSRTAHPRLVVLGRLVPHKRIEIAIRALARISAENPSAELVIAGQGWWAANLRAEAERLGVADRVRLAGYVSEADKHDLLASSWLHLVPSLKEGWGLSVMEAAAHGTPSVAFRHAGGVAESIVDTQTGFLAADEDDFVRYCEVLIGDVRLRADLGSAARTHASAFSWDETGKRFAQVLEGALRRTPAANVDPAALPRV